MRQSLSNSGGRAALVAVALAAALAVATVIDQSGGRALAEHATNAYAQHGKQASESALYGLLYGVAVFDAALWLLVAGLSGPRRTIATGLAVLSILLTATLAVVLLTASEYDVHPFPPLWGTLALLPAAAGLLAVVTLFRHR